MYRTGQMTTTALIPYHCNVNRDVLLGRYLSMLVHLGIAVRSRGKWKRGEKRLSSHAIRSDHGVAEKCKLRAVMQGLARQRVLLFCDIVLDANLIPLHVPMLPQGQHASINLLHDTFPMDGDGTIYVGPASTHDLYARGFEVFWMVAKIHEQEWLSCQYAALCTCSPLHQVCTSYLMEEVPSGDIVGILQNPSTLPVFSSISSMYIL